MATPKKHRYKHVDGKRLIEIRVKTAAQLFDVRDPAPFRERDLDDDFVDYIISSAKEFSHATSLKIVIYIEAPEEATLDRDAIKEAIHSHSAYSVELQEQRLRDFIRRGQIALLMGLTILFGCVGLSEALPQENSSRWLAILREGSIIIGWVSMWRPMELLLYDWWPIYGQLRLLRKILATEFEIRFGQRA